MEEGSGIASWTEVTAMSRPPSLRSIMSRAASCRHRTGASRFSAMVVRQAFQSISSGSYGMPPPALATQTWQPASERIMRSIT